MAELIIVPLNTEIKKHTLEQIAKVTGLRFKSKYDGVNVLNHQDINRSTNPNLFSFVDTSETYGFTAHNFCGRSSIFDYLNEIYGDQDVLAVSDLPIVVLGRDTVHGRCDSNRKKAIVSQLSIQSEPEDLRREVLIALSIHETGHMHGLKDHLAKIPGGKYCVMTQFDMIAEDVGKSSIEPEHYKLRANQPCRDCEHHLINPDSTKRQPQPSQYIFSAEKTGKNEGRSRKISGLYKKGERICGIRH